MCGEQVNENPLHAVPTANEEESIGTGVRAVDPDPEAGKGEGHRGSISETLDVASVYPHRFSATITRDNPAFSM